MPMSSITLADAFCLIDADESASRMMCVARIQYILGEMIFLAPERMQFFLCKAFLNAGFCRYSPSFVTRTI